MEGRGHEKGRRERCVMRRRDEGWERRRRREKHSEGGGGGEGRNPRRSSFRTDQILSGLLPLLATSSILTLLAPPCTTAR
eukprot:749217-Hanusia_phi.AAC.4